MITIRYIDYNVERIEQFPSDEWKQAKRRALYLSKVGCKRIRVTRDPESRKGTSS